MKLKESIYTIKYSLFAATVIAVLLSLPAQAQEVNGLNGWSIFLDPGHSQTENQGAFGYSEAEKTLRVALALREMLLEQTDIDTVYMSRMTDAESVELTQRTDLANNLQPDFYYSIHSNAGSSSTNNTLMLYGGWQENGVVVEKTPNGGKDMGDFLTEELTDAMRIPTIGNWADRTFYQGFVNHSNTWPYLHVNRESDMASVLSEGGFHTNPTQQQRNLNADWKRLEARAAFWSVLRYMEAERPQMGIMTGFITNKEDNRPLNGITITIDDKSYTTDTYESLFHEYSAVPGELRNGFYYLEELSNELVDVYVEGPGYYADTLQTEVLSDDFTFLDIKLISNVPPYIASTFPAEGDSILEPGDPIEIRFSRDMNQTSVESAFSASENFEGEISWENNRIMFLSTDSLLYKTAYFISIDSTAFDASPYAHHLDADGDSVSGGVFTLNFKTAEEDTLPPAIVDVYPSIVDESELLPIIGVTFDEHLDINQLSNSSLKLSRDGEELTGTRQYYEVGKKSIFHFFPDEKLLPNAEYIITVAATVTDEKGNNIGADKEFIFNTTNRDIATEVVIDNFDSGNSAWWAPDQSGSSNAFISDITKMESETSIVNEHTNSAAALRLNYGWDINESGHLIRQYKAAGTPNFSDSHIIKAYVFGDGLGNQLRFVVDEDPGYEASNWITVDWIGWRAVTWDMANDDVNGWVNGNGTVQGTLHFDSFQLTYTEGKENIGFYIFDDLIALKYGEPTSNEEPVSEGLPTQIALEQNYPNPFNPVTTISYKLPVNGKVRLDVFDIMGRKVATLVDGQMEAGTHQVAFDASALASGVYLYRLRVNETLLSKKMLLMK